MNAFVNAVKSEQTVGTTFNGAVTNTTTRSRVLDLFAAAGNRAVDLSKEFDMAVSEDKKLACRVALWARDIRGGAGERQTFRLLLKHLEQHYPDDVIALMSKIPELGRWDDLLVFNTDRVQHAAFVMISDALNDNHALCAKWMPRKGAKAEWLRKFLGLTPKQYRKTLGRITKVVETQMCAKDWDNIVFDHVPSVAAARYQKAFNKHCGQAYVDYRNGLTKVNSATGQTERKINAGAVYPYDVIKSIDSGDRQVALAQWEALPNFLGDNKILPIVDVSASMGSFVYYDQKNPVKGTIRPIDVAVSIGLYCADKQKGAFAGTFMNFSTHPKIQHLTGDLVSKMAQINRSQWDMSTNVEGAFLEILRVARANNISAADMPAVLLILSDMEFDSCISNKGLSNFNNAQLLFEAAGYKLPTVVFWNINGRADNAPVKMNETGTAIVSGFSPAIFKSILKSDMSAYSPYNVMLDTIMSDRYTVEGLTNV